MIKDVGSLNIGHNGLKKDTVTTTREKTSSISSEVIVDLP